MSYYNIGRAVYIFVKQKQNSIYEVRHNYPNAFLVLSSTTEAVNYINGRNK